MISTALSSRRRSVFGLSAVAHVRVSVCGYWSYSNFLKSWATACGNSLNLQLWCSWGQFVDQKVKGQSHGETKCGQKHFGDFEGHEFKGQRFSVDNRLVLWLHSAPSCSVLFWRQTLQKPFSFSWSVVVYGVWFETLDVKSKFVLLVLEIWTDALTLTLA